jgi:predicted nucleic acid-binding protein
MIYFDTGVLLKLYLPKPRSSEAMSLVNTSGNKPPITHLHELEMRSALRQKVGRGELTLAECQTLLEELDADVAAPVFELVSVPWPDVFVRSEAISAAHGASTLCRSLDTLHVALALELGADEFCTFDHRQSLMASAAGLRAIP